MAVQFRFIPHGPSWWQYVHTLHQCTYNVMQYIIDWCTFDFQILDKPLGARFFGPRLGAQLRRRKSTPQGSPRGSTEVWNPMDLLAAVQNVSRSASRKTTTTTPTATPTPTPTPATTITKTTQRSTIPFCFFFWGGFLHGQSTVFTSNACNLYYIRTHM